MAFQIVKLLNPINMTISGTFNPMGAYDNATNYSVGDQVSYNGSSYIMFSDAAAGTLPTNTTYWGLVASKGDTGATGPQGNPTTVNGKSGASITLNIDDVAPTQSGNSGKVLKTDGTNATWQTDSNNGTWGSITGTLSDQTDLNSALGSKVDKNTAITGATKTKVTYDSKGLVTAGADATTADIADSTDKRYITDAQQTVLTNTSGTNTGDETTSTIKTKLGITTLSGSNTGDQDLSGLQPLDATLTSLASYNTNGLLTQTAADTFTGRTITGTANQINVSNGNGVSGNPTLSLPQNIHTGATPTFAGATINGYIEEGLYLNPNVANTNTAPQVVSQIKQNGRGVINAVAAMSGFGDYFYCLDRNPAYVLTTTNVVNANQMFDSDLSGGADIAVANLATDPAIIEITRADGGRINFTDVLKLWIAGQRLYNEETLTSYKVETKCSDGVWRTELDRTGVSDQINGIISIPLHVYGATYAADDTPPPSNGWHACHGIRLTIRGATAPSWNSGKFRIAELQLRDSRPMYTPARGLGALDMRGGEMYGDISSPSSSGMKIATSSGQKIAFYGATPIVRPTSTPANATDLASAIALANDLKAKLIALGLIS